MYELKENERWIEGLEGRYFVNTKSEIWSTVRKAFIPNPEGKETVNHINGNKQDNRLENLEWATHKEQRIHAYSNLTRKPAKPRIKLKDTKYREEVADRYIQNGGTLESKYFLNRYITEDDFDRNGIPYELFSLKKGKSYLERWLLILVIGCCLDNKKSLSVISNITGLDSSYISKIRSGKNFQKELEIYHKYKNNPKYIDKHISKISLLYNS